MRFPAIGCRGLLEGARAHAHTEIRTCLGPCRPVSRVLGLALAGPATCLADVTGRWSPRIAGHRLPLDYRLLLMRMHASAILSTLQTTMPYP